MDFNFNDEHVLEDNIVMLRPLHISDFDFLSEYSVNEPEIWQYNAPGAAGHERLRKYIDNAITQRQEEKEYPFIVYDKRTGKYIGSTRFYDFRVEHKTIQLGYTWYGKAYQGTGINKHCKYMLLQFAFEKLGVERVGFGANNKNERSKNAMKSIGCIEEGVLRNFSFDANGERMDSVVLSILRHEWFGHVKTALRNKLITQDGD